MDGGSKFETLKMSAPSKSRPMYYLQREQQQKDEVEREKERKRASRETVAAFRPKKRTCATPSTSDSGTESDVVYKKLEHPHLDGYDSEDFLGVMPGPYYCYKQNASRKRDRRAVIGFIFDDGSFCPLHLTGGRAPKESVLGVCMPSYHLLGTTDHQ